MSTSSFPPQELREIVKEVATLLKDRKETISVAETAAGGLISSSLLSYPGASSFYRGGLTLYTLESRKAFVGWTDADTQNYKGPTPDIVTKLADNTRKTLESTYAVSESGTAGPTGGNNRNRTPGYVALAVSKEGGTVTREVETGSKEREGNMVMFAFEALKLVRDTIKGEGGGKDERENRSGDVQEEGVKLVPGDKETDEAAVGAFAS
ncbi:hypothetical protein BU25DRAFT_385300 [Macroventuria anomochaeta]|uniref:Uncharacterized protein n=1 Tax=Macroventuria anomochaeta TaxID=301207 RepID=A0ACB6SBQ0_9PLEO|nr:uncharacterized protein BU25DRAFT_385300 [Macroventuria anomochaeta]KAF2631731.1 hypothetical protein BU25DRAFT_385300 [Macroventuria anomochaeta]